MNPRIIGSSNLSSSAKVGQGWGVDRGARHLNGPSGSLEHRSAISPTSQWCESRCLLVALTTLLAEDPRRGLAVRHSLMAVGSPEGRLSVEPATRSFGFVSWSAVYPRRLLSLRVWRRAPPLLEHPAEISINPSMSVELTRRDDFSAGTTKWFVQVGGMHVQSWRTATFEVPASSWFYDVSVFQRATYLPLIRFECNRV